jgi:uncharacterized protein YndB with AHSA1/START domain
MSTKPLPAAGPIVCKAVVVAAPLAVAFEVFTAQIEAWWPMASHHIGQADCAAVVIEPRAGGRWFERGVDGTECDWGHVLLWDAPNRVTLMWQLSAQFQFDRSIETEVDVCFTALDAHTTRVDLEHRGLDAYGADAAAMRATFDSPNGWNGMLEQYAQVAGRLAAART